MVRHVVGNQVKPLHSVRIRRRNGISILISSSLKVTLTFAVIILPWCLSSSINNFIEAFISTSCAINRVSNYSYDKTSISLCKARTLTTAILASDNEDDDVTNNLPASKSAASDITRRFTSPIIDDPGLPLSDVLVAQVVAPSLQIAWISAQHAPQPSWLQPIFDTSVLYTNRGVLLAPALIHGAALASCWITGALAAKAYERKAISPVPVKSQPTLSSSPSNEQWDYSNVILSIFKSGAFAVGLLILATQIDLFLEYGRYVQVGESDDIDFRLLVAVVEVINDIVFEAVTIAAWRLFLAYQTERMSKD
jgi:hypothetical protein